MGQFDTHGGYFAPKDYIRINEGGSHEENPNGGVQLGVDPQGIPNMVEEGESVYKDFVFSDNITAEESFLKEYHLPVKYAGKLFSEIADKFVDEAEVRPNDPISNNGLNAMLVRLSECQEAQKQAREQAELEEELSNLSPEEFDQLEAMLAQGAQGPSGYPGDPGVLAAPEMVGPAEPVEQVSAEEMPMMANGGLLRKFTAGGDIPPVTEEELRARGLNYGNNYTPVRMPSVLEMALGSDNAIVRGVNAVNDFMQNTAAGRVIDALVPDSATEAFSIPFAKAGKAAKAAYSVADIEAQVGKWSKETELATKALEDAKAVLKNGRNAAGDVVSKDVAKAAVERARKDLKLAQGELSRYSRGLRGAGKTVEQVGVVAKTTEPVAEVATETAEKSPSLLKALVNPLYGAGKQTARALADKSPFFRYPVAAAAQAGQWGANIGLVKGMPVLVDSWKNPFDGETVSESNGQPELDFGEWDFENGGKMNRFDGGGWTDFLTALNNYSTSRNRGGVRGKYRIDSRFPLYGYNSILELEQSDPYKAFTQYVIDNPDNENVRNYLRALDAGTADWTQKLYDGNALRSNWADLYRTRRNDQKGGIYHFSGNWDNLDNLAALYSPIPVGEEPAVVSSSPVTPDASVPFYQQRIPDNLAIWRYRQRMGISGVPQTLDVSVPPVQNPYERANEPTLFPGITLGVTRPSEEEAGASPVADRIAGIGALSTFPRYAAPLMAGALGIYNAFQEPDRYDIPRINPVLPVGRLNLRDPEYNPLDQEMAVNNVLATNAGAVRALGASGLGPSTGAAIIAADNGATGNIGSTRTQVWDANNQRRNDVIAAHNQNASAIGNFDYGISRDRATIENQAKMQNLQMELYRQRLNYAAEAEKYAAIQSQIDAIADALAGIGRENIALNQINSNSALYHNVGPNGWAVYSGKNGGFLKKCK